MSHKSEAERLLPGRGGGLAPNAALHANAHATLALVEQQRIANKLSVALIEQLGEIARLLSSADDPREPKVNPWESLNVAERQEIEWTP